MYPYWKFISGYNLRRSLDMFFDSLFAASMYGPIEAVESIRNTMSNSFIED